MEGDDIALIFRGLRHALDSSLLSNHSHGFCKTSGELDHNVFRPFININGKFTGEYKEMNNDISMSADLLRIAGAKTKMDGKLTYIEYLHIQGW